MAELINIVINNVIKMYTSTSCAFDRTYNISNNLYYTIPDAHNRTKCFLYFKYRWNNNKNQ